MPPNAVEPGTRLVDRYRLEEHLGEAARHVVLAGARRAARPAGRRLPARRGREPAPTGSCAPPAARPRSPTPGSCGSSTPARSTDVVYVVTEWVRATQPHRPAGRRAAAAGRGARSWPPEVADALAAAHGEGLAHLCLQPEHVLRTAHGQVKVVGLAVDAAVRGVEADRPGRRGPPRRRGRGGVALRRAHRALARARGRPGWPPAPYDGDALCSPRQVRAGIPHDLDQVVCRALGSRGSGGAALVTPGGARHGARRRATSRPGSRAVRPAGTGTTDSFPPGRLAPYERLDGRAGRTQPHDRAGLGASWRSSWCVGLGLAGWQLVITVAGRRRRPGGVDRRRQLRPTGSRRPDRRPVEVAAVTSFDPPPDGNGEENDDRAALAVDGDRSTAWTTKTYFDQFGPAGLKDGVGLVLDLGRADADVSRCGRAPRAATGLSCAPPTSRAAALDDFDAGRRSGRRRRPRRAAARPRPLRARYLLVWLTVAAGGRRPTTAARSPRSSVRG